MKKEKPATRHLIKLSLFVFGAIFGYVIALTSGSNPSIIPVISATIGLVVAFTVPVFQAFFINNPKLSVEINSIKRNISETSHISIDDDPELRPIKPRRESGPYVQFGDDGEPPHDRQRAYSLIQIEEYFANSKRRLRDLPTLIEDRKKELDRVNSLTAITLSKYECDRLNGPLFPEIEFNPQNPEETLKSLRDAYQKRLDSAEKRYADLQSNLPAAERRIELLKEDLLNNRSYFTVSVSLINSGKSNTAIKVPALLRVSIGEGNYIDLKLTLKDFEEKSEISANGTRIVIFESSEVSSLPEEDRKLINTYWGQSVKSKLLLEDIHSAIYTSNSIAFAEGLYQKIIYDRLARAASET